MALLRFAPSPTGSLHLGGLRTVLFNHLLSRKLGGKWLLRIEDTDASRTVPGAVDEIVRGLEWAGLPPDHGPSTGGPHGPYYQSQRLDLYKSYAEKLLEHRHAYRCFCSPDSLAETRARLLSLGSNATYDRKCLHLTDEEVHRRLRAGEKHVVRLLDTAVPTRASVRDMVFGAFKDVHTSLPTDAILLKSDNFPTYHLASVVDDHEMGITHVLRGEEWLASLPLHLDLYSCLRWTPPEFGHLPLLLNSDGTKMSKRTTGMHVASFMEADFEPEAVLNWLFLLGLSSHAFDQEFYLMEDMLTRFSIDSFSTHRAILEHSKLVHLNGIHLQHKAKLLLNAEDVDARLAKRACKTVAEQLPLAKNPNPSEVLRALVLVEDRVQTLPDLPKAAPYLFVSPDYSTDEAKRLKASVPSDIYREVVGIMIMNEEQPATWEDALRRAKEALKGKATNKQIMATLRHALTGMEKGPPLAGITQLLGQDQVKARLQNILDVALA